MTEKKQYGALDYFRVIAAFLVVCIHTFPLASLNIEAINVISQLVSRIAVPFFLMVSGYFLLPRYIFENAPSKSSLTDFVRKISILYLFSIILYLPLNLYAGHFDGKSFIDILLMLLFKGTFYHLWYLPGLILATAIIYILSKYFTTRLTTAFVVLLYIIGLFGDSYYGFIENNIFFANFYKPIFYIFEYTRSGLFYAPIFLLMGALISRYYIPKKHKYLKISFVVFFILMLLEGYALNYYNISRHTTMYIFLIPCMISLFCNLLSINKTPIPAFRSISTFIYIIHPFTIVLIRGAAKFTNTLPLLVDNSIVHYILVCGISFSLGYVAYRLVLYFKKNKNIGTARAWIEIDRNSLRYNINSIKSMLDDGCELMPAIKANGYGHGAVLIAKELSALKISSLCVATVFEAIELRKAGIRSDILVLGYTHVDSIFLLHRYKIIQTVLSYDYAQQLNAYGKKITVDIKLDTGMHRLGEEYTSIEKIRHIFALKNLKIRGVYTHFCAADILTVEGENFTRQQSKAFEDTISALKLMGCKFKKSHLHASYSFLNYPDIKSDYLRAGILIYGILSCKEDMLHCPISLKPILSLKARVSLVKSVKKGENVGYALQYTAENDIKIAVLSIGYADGLPRSLGNIGVNVLINGHAAPIIGRICMDQAFVDVTLIPNVSCGDIAVIIGKSGSLAASVYDIAESSQTITNEILSRLGDRLPRYIV